MALTLQPIRGFHPHSGERGTCLMTVIHKRLPNFFLREGGHLYRGYTNNIPMEKYLVVA